MKVLITGAAGFVGRNIMRYIAREHPDWLMICNDIRPEMEAHPNQRKFVGDCRDLFGSTDGEWVSDVDLVIHLAAVVGGRVRIDGDPLGVATDLAIDAEMFNWALRTKPGKIVYFSSSAAYPIQFQMRGNPITPLREGLIDFGSLLIGMPDATYGWSKLSGELLAMHARDQRLDVSIFRPFSGYGPDQDFDYPFPSFLARAVRKQNPFPVWGDGTSQRDWIHIDDIVEAVFSTVLPMSNVGPLNLGTGIATDFDRLALKMAAHAGWPAPPTLEHLAGPEGVHTRVADVSLMRKFYTPKISLDQGIVRSLPLMVSRLGKEQ